MFCQDNELLEVVSKTRDLMIRGFQQKWLRENMLMYAMRQNQTLSNALEERHLYTKSQSQSVCITLIWLDNFRNYAGRDIYYLPSPLAKENMHEKASNCASVAT